MNLGQLLELIDKVHSLQIELNGVEEWLDNNYRAPKEIRAQYTERMLGLEKALLNLKETKIL